MSILVAKNVSKSFSMRGKEINVLNDLNLELMPGHSLAITGPSGSGKSTLITILSAIEAPDQGELTIAGCRVNDNDQAQRSKIRTENISIVFQEFNLIQSLTAIENVKIAADIIGLENTNKRAEDALESVGLLSRAHHLPEELSGGEAQRVAIARAIVTNPKILLADEPSGNLDQENGDRIIEILMELTKKSNTALILVTHNQRHADECAQVLRLQKGRLVE
jgi:putative ABC transport system ATP-binding protein